MDKLKYTLFLILYFFSTPFLYGQQSSSFEMRYFTTDSTANGETDFKGGTEWMNTNQRISSLNDYTNYASRYFNNPKLDQLIVNDDEINNLLKKLKPQPTPNVRKVYQLNEWKAYGYREGEKEEKKEALTQWSNYAGAEVSDGVLNLQDASISKTIDSLYWRFKLETKLHLSDRASLSLRLLGKGKESIDLQLLEGKVVYKSNHKTKERKIPKSKWLTLKIETDFTEHRFNLYLDNQLIEDFILMPDTTASVANQFVLESNGKVQLGELFLFNHSTTDNPERPYSSEVVIDEDFSQKAEPLSWQDIAYDDSFWDTTNLPAVHGGIREEGEDLYLRKKIKIDNSFERATLDIEALDPGGEIWVNGRIVDVVKNRRPKKVDISKYLLPKQENLIAIRVKAHTSHVPVFHAPDDQNIGWFLGRTKLILGSRKMITSINVQTKELNDEQAVQSHNIQVQYSGRDYTTGSLEVNYYPWFPEESPKATSKVKEIEIRPNVKNEFTMEIPVSSPKLWDASSPNLYKVEVILRDEKGTAIDDQVLTTGIRTIEQKNGNFLVNGHPEMLNGAQIMGFRTPIEDMAKYNRSAPDKTVAAEMIMLQKMNANLLRIHVHAQEDTTDGINDPRYAELADQMGIYLIWQTAGWLREGEVWNIDFDGYPQYMEQVYNHPSIVIWEAANHPNRFKEHDLRDTQDYVKKIYHTIHDKDSSRLISPTTYWQHTHYGNCEGTLDYEGNAIEAIPEYNAPLMTRGGQDAYSGYGAEWSKIREMPTDFANSCLSAEDKAYFNFEHEESAAQPNWNLSKGKPWYKVQSYEWDYEKGSIGRKLKWNEWRASQAWQAFSAWESMKLQMLLGYDGFSWCTLHGGPNMGTYQKPLIDNQGHPKLAYYINRMIFQPTWAGSDNVDVVYGPSDEITPVIHHIGGAMNVKLEITLKDKNGKGLNKHTYNNIKIDDGRGVYKLDSFQFNNVPEGNYFIEYNIYELDERGV